MAFLFTGFIAVVILLFLWKWFKTKHKNSGAGYTPASDIFSGVDRPFSAEPPGESTRKVAYAEIVPHEEALDLQEKYPVMAGADPFYFSGNNIGVLVIHGFTGTAQSMYDIGQSIAEAGHSVYGVRLTGHGTHPEDMEEATHQDWIDDVEAGLRKLKATCSSIFVLGLSMGGTLTLYLAEKHPEIVGIMPINAAVDMEAFKSNYQQLNESGERFVEGIGSDIKQAGVTELAYEQTPVKAMGELVVLMQAVKENLSKINMPVLIFSSDEDHVVPPENAQMIYDGISSEDKTRIPMTDSYHVATLDNDSSLIASECLVFIHKLADKG